MSEVILKDHSTQLKHLSDDLSKLIKIREDYHETTEKLLFKKLSEENAMIKSIEFQMENIVQRTKNWPKSVMIRSSYNPSVSVTAFIHCKKCLEKVSVSRSTQTQPSFIQSNKRSNPSLPISPRPLRGILRTSSNDSIFKTDISKGKKEEKAKTAFTAKKENTKKDNLMEWSAMEWNGKDEIKEINQKIKTLNDRINHFSLSAENKNQHPDALSTGLKGIALTAAMEKRLDKLEKDILYLDSSL